MILCEERVLFSGITVDVERRLKEQFSGGNRTSKFLLKNKPLVPIKKIKYRNKKLAQQASKRIMQLKDEQKEDFIIKSFLKKQQPISFVEVSKDRFEICCNECGFISVMTCKYSDLNIELINFECLHETIKKKLDSLFEQAILGAGCFHNGRFMFQGKNEDKARDYLLGFSELGHRKRTMAAYEALDEISFKNSYLLLSAILEESYYFIEEYAAQYSEYKLPKDYTRSSFKSSGYMDIFQKNPKLRFGKIAHFVQLIANVLKHSGGIIKEKGSGKELIKIFKIKKDWDVVSLRKYIKISGTQIGDIFNIIIKLYVFICDFIALIFNFKKFRVKTSEYQYIFKKITNYDVREDYIDFLNQVQQDGSVIFMDLQNL